MFKLCRIHHYIRTGPLNLAHDLDFSVYARPPLHFVASDQACRFARFGLTNEKEYMKIPLKQIRRRPALLLPFSFGLAALVSCSQAADAPREKADAPAASGDLVPLVVKLPPPAFKGTPKDLQLSSFVEPLSDKPRPPMMVPPGLKNLAKDAKLTSSDKNATSSVLEKITDGDKEASDQSIIFLRKGSQWVQMDLGASAELFAILIWHAHNTAKVYHAVVAQLSDDPDFLKDVRTIFNNDQLNASGLGVGTDREYFETFEGKLINAKGAKARYIRFYCKGSTESALNEYTEIEVYGRPAQ